jgi:hypothetical protein
MSRLGWITDSISSNWRTVVLSEAQRLEEDLHLAGVDAAAPSLARIEVASGILRARDAAAAKSSLASWWSGRMVEQAWEGLQAAREALTLIQDEPTLRAQLPVGADNPVHIRSALRRARLKEHRSGSTYGHVLLLLDAASPSGVGRAARPVRAHQ